MSMPAPKAETFRLVTRGDLDGLICAVLLKELNMIDDILFAAGDEPEGLGPELAYVVN